MRITSLFLSASKQELNFSAAQAGVTTRPRAIDITLSQSTATKQKEKKNIIIFISFHTPKWFVVIFFVFFLRVYIHRGKRHCTEKGFDVRDGFLFFFNNFFCWLLFVPIHHPSPSGPWLCQCQCGAVSQSATWLRLYSNNATVNKYFSSKNISWLFSLL